MVSERAIGKIARVFVAKVEPDNDLLIALRDIVAKEGIKSGTILSCVGSLKRLKLRNLKTFPKQFPVKDENRFYRVIEKPFEILALSGNIAQKDTGEVVIHAHIAVSSVRNEEVITMGGHLVEGNITYVMVEVIIAELEGIKMRRTWQTERKAWELALG